jgi:cell division protease FtsH
MGLERKSMILSEEEKRTTAYHEAGHALVARILPYADPLHKVTIIPRGRALGLTQQLPQDDRHTYSKNFLLDSIAIFMGGRVAEEIVLSQMTTGAANDIERATQLARRMVCEWGMSEEMGPLSFGKREEQVFLGRDIAQHRDYSEQTALSIDREVRRIVESNYDRANGILTEYVQILHGIAGALLERETLELRDVDRIIAATNTQLMTMITEQDKARSKPERMTAEESQTGQTVAPANPTGDPTPEPTEEEPQDKLPGSES